MPTIIKNAGNAAASVEIIETATGNKDGVTLMAGGKITLREGWDIAPASALTNSRLIVHRPTNQAVPQADPKIPSKANTKGVI